MQKTIFERIIAGELSSDKLYEDELCIAIADINPQAPVHVLVIPREPIPRLADAQPAHQAMLGHLLLVAAKMAERQGIGEAFRLVVNSGADAGQTVFHLHVHVLGGQRFREQLA